MVESPRPPTFEKITELRATLAGAPFSGAGTAPQVIQISTDEMQALLSRLRSWMTPADYQVVEAMVRTVQQADELLERSDLALHRLLRMAESLQRRALKASCAKNRTGRRAHSWGRPWRR